MSSTVLIAGTDHLEALKGRPEFADAFAFPETDTPRALEAIMRHRPEVVAIEKVFAGKSRGVALINRIKADSTLAGCEIRIVAPDGTYSKVASKRAAGSAPASALASSAPPLAPLDQKGTRRSPRFQIIEGIEVTVDGNPALLVDLSVVGAQVISGTLLKPNQRVRLSFIEGKRPIRFSAGVAWSAFELPKGEPRYRAGIEFFDADPAAVGRFCDINRRDAEKR